MTREVIDSPAVLCKEPITPVEDDSPPQVVRIENPCSHPDWDKWIEGAGATFFHSAAWARVLEQTYGFTPIYFAIVQEDRPVFLLPVMEVNSWLTGRRGVSLPFTDHCEALGPGGAAPAAMLEILQHGRDRGWKYLECRGGTPFENASPSISFFGHRLPLAAESQPLFARFESSVRRAIRKAEKSSLDIEISSSLDALRDYFSLHCLTRRQHGLPPQPFRFFLNIHRHVVSQNLGMIVSAKYRERPIASAMFFHAGAEVIYKFGASDPAFQELRANNLVMWEAIKWCIRNGKKILDFGRTSAANDGLRRYKLGWGAEERPIHYYKYDFRTGAFVTAKDESLGWHTRLFHAVPVPVARFIGALLYKHTA